MANQIGNKPLQLPVLAFDPGATTGFAALNSSGKLLFTRAVMFEELDGFVEFCSWPVNTKIVMETGPKWGHHSPITKRAEQTITKWIPDVYRVTPNQWKGHPAADLEVSNIFRTVHEKDAAGLARWFRITGEKTNGETKEGNDTARTDTTRSRRKRN